MSTKLKNVLVGLGWTLTTFAVVGGFVGLIDTCAAPHTIFRDGDAERLGYCALLIVGGAILGAYTNKKQEEPTPKKPTMTPNEFDDECKRHAETLQRFEVQFRQ